MWTWIRGLCGRRGDEKHDDDDGDEPTAPLIMARRTVAGHREKTNEEVAFEAAVADVTADVAMIDALIRQNEEVIDCARVVLDKRYKSPHGRVAAPGSSRESAARVFPSVLAYLNTLYGIQSSNHRLLNHATGRLRTIKTAGFVDNMHAQVRRLQPFANASGGDRVRDKAEHQLGAVDDLADSLHDLSLPLDVDTAYDAGYPIDAAAEDFDFEAIVSSMGLTHLRGRQPAAPAVRVPRPAASDGLPVAERLEAAAPHAALQLDAGTGATRDVVLEIGVGV